MKGNGRSWKHGTARRLISFLLLAVLLFQGAVYDGAINAYASEDAYTEEVSGTGATAEEEEAKEEEVQDTETSEESSQAQDQTESVSESAASAGTSDSSQNQESGTVRDSSDAQSSEDNVTETETEIESEEVIESATGTAAVLMADASDPNLNLARYITGVSAKQLVDGSWEDLTEGASLKNGDSLRIQIYWTIDASDFAVYRNNTFYYQLPQGFELPAAISGNILYGDGATAGTFNIDASGLVTISYDSTYNTNNLSTDNYLILDGNTKQYEGGDTNTITFIYDEGDTEIEFSNKYDFSIEKKAEKVAQDNEISIYEYIDYTITISSEWGTEGTITLKDVLSRNKSNTGGGVVAQEYDLESITVDGVKITDAASSYALSDVDNKTSTANKTFTIADLSQLGAGESHVITYRVNVRRQRTAIPSTPNTWAAVGGGSVDNTAYATSGGVTKEATAVVDYARRISKNASTFNSTTGRINWQIVIYQDPDNGEDLTGYKLVDNLTESVGSAAFVTASNFSIGYYTTSDRAYAGIKFLTADEISQYVKFDTENDTFTFTFPAAPDGVTIYGWRINYYVDTVGDSSGAINIVNNAKIYKDTENSTVWEVTSTKIGTITAVATPTKEFVEAKDAAGSSTLKKLTWNVSADYSGATQQTYTVTDTLGTPTNVQTTETYTGAHYGTIYDLLMTLLDTLEIDVTIDGTDYKITYDWDSGWSNLNGAVVSISLKDKDGNPLVITSDAIASLTQTEVDAFLAYYKQLEADESRNIYSFDITYTRTPQTKADGTTQTQELKSISASYETYLDTSKYESGSLWNVDNQFSAQGSTAQDNYRYSTQVQDVLKAVDVPKSASGGSANFVFSDTSMPYSYVRTDTDGSKYILYEILLEVGDTEYDKIVVTDVIPEGTYLKAESNSAYASYTYVWAGPYVNNVISYGTNSDYPTLNWSYANRRANISLSQDTVASGTQLTFTLKNINKEGGLYAVKTSDDGTTVGTGVIGIRYRLYISDWDKVFSESVTEDEDGNVIVNYQRSNTATWEGHSSYTINLNVQKEETVLDKTGEQQKTASGSTTSTAHYSIKINEAKVKLLEDGSTAEGVTLVDTITSNDLYFQLDRSSIKLYKLDDDGNKVETEITNIQFSDADDQNQTITMVVEDATAYVLEYDYNVTGTVQNGVSQGTLSNSASLNGITKTVETTTVQNLNAIAASDFGGVTIYKVDSKNQLVYLSGAEFKLEYYDKAADTFVEASNFVIQTTSGYVFDYYAAANALSGNTLYRIVETKAPDEYALDTTPTYFVIKGNIEDGKANLVIREDADSLSIATDGRTSITVSDGKTVSVSSLSIQMLSPSSSGTIYISNTKMGSLRIVKKNSKDEVLSKAKFALYKDKDGERGDLVTDSLVSAEDGTIELPGLAQGTYHLVETEAPSGYVREEEDIVFRISENDTVLLSSTENVTTDTVTEVQNEGTDQETETLWHVVTVTNQLITYSLPTAGGDGLRAIMRALMLLCAAFVSVLIGKEIYRRRTIRR